MFGEEFGAAPGFLQFEFLQERGGHLLETSPVNAPEGLGEVMEGLLDQQVWKAETLDESHRITRCATPTEHINIDSDASIILPATLKADTENSGGLHSSNQDEYCIKRAHSEASTTEIGSMSDDDGVVALEHNASEEILRKAFLGSGEEALEKLATLSGEWPPQDMGEAFFAAKDVVTKVNSPIKEFHLRDFFTDQLLSCRPVDSKDQFSQVLEEVFGGNVRDDLRSQFLKSVDHRRRLRGEDAFASAKRKKKNPSSKKARANKSATKEPATVEDVAATPQYQ